MTDSESHLEQSVSHAAETEAHMREVNERVVDAIDRADVETETLDLMCECADDTCEKMLHISRDLYESTRSHGDQFVVEPDHLDPDIEFVVERRDDCWVVEKFGEAGSIVRERSEELDNQER